MRKDVNVVVFNGDLLDFNAKLSGVMSIHTVKCRKRGGMTKAARHCRSVDFKNDMNRIPRRERARPAAVPRSTQSSSVTPAAVLENELLACHVTDTSWVEVGMQTGVEGGLGFS